jgi:hypothetical protein
LETLPSLRTDIQLSPLQYQGRQVLAVGDSLGLREGVAVLSPQILPLLPLFDGTHTVRHLQLAMMRMAGNRLVMERDARRVVGELDRLLLLKTERYDALLREAKGSFAALPRRAPAMAGTAYPAEALAARGMLEKILGGMPEYRAGSSEPVRVLVAPHIELGTGAETYGKAYAHLQSLAPERIVVLGTGHALDNGLFSLTDKPYDTPLGAFPVDDHSLDALRRSGSALTASDDFAHRSEHSIEFQVLFLRHLMPRPIPMIPILCGSVTEWLDRVERPGAIPGVSAFLDALRVIVDHRTLVVAAIDLSHVGPKFGDSEPAHALEPDFREHDRRLLDALCNGSVIDLWSEARRVGDRYHVCGLPVLAWLLELLPDLRGHLLDYRVWHEAATRSAVSFAGVVLR